MSPWAVWMRPARASTWVASRRGTPPTRAATWRWPWGRAASSCRWGPRRCRCLGLAPTVRRGALACVTLTAGPRRSLASWSCLQATWRRCRRPVTTWGRWEGFARIPWRRVRLRFARGVRPSVRLGVRLGLCRIVARVKHRVKHLWVVVLPDMVVASHHSVAMCVVPGPPTLMRPFMSMRLAPGPPTLMPPSLLVRLPTPMFLAFGRLMLVCQAPPYACWTTTSSTRARGIPLMQVYDRSVSWPRRVCWQKPCRRRCSSIRPSMFLTSWLAGPA